MKSLLLKMPDELYEAVKAEADKGEIGVSEYIREALKKNTGCSIGKKSEVVLDMGVMDIRGLEEEIEHLITTVNGVCTVMYNSGKAYEGDIKTIIEEMRGINNSVNTFIKAELDSRHALYQEARGRVFEDINENRIKKHTYRKESNS